MPAAADSIISLSPWTVIKLTPRSAARSTPCLTVSPISNILVSRKTFLPRLIKSSSSPSKPAANSSHNPILKNETTPSSRSQLGGGLPVWITNIEKLPDGRIGFHIGYEYE